MTRQQSHHALSTQRRHLSRIQTQFSQDLIGVLAQARRRAVQHRRCAHQAQWAGHCLNDVRRYISDSFFPII